LTFYVNYIILPTFQRDNIELSLENSKTKKKLDARESTLYTDSLKLIEAKNRNDSILGAVNSQRVVLDSVKKAFNNLLLSSESHSQSTSGGIAQAVVGVKKALKNLNIDSNLNSNLHADKSNVTINVSFGGGMGHVSLGIFLNGTQLEKFAVDRSESLSAALVPGLYYFMVIGYAEGNISLNIQGKGIKITPNTPVTFGPGLFNPSFVVEVQ
jgi:hypothetical protein